MAYQVVTDSCSDLPENYSRQGNLMVIPMQFTMGGEEYYDNFGKSMPYPTFYEKLRAGLTSTTSLINHVQFSEVFTPVLEQGIDILYLAFSSALSGTYQSAVVAARELSAKYPKRTIAVVDTKCASMGEGLLVHYALNLRDDGKSLEEVRSWVEQNKLMLCHWFTVSDLEHLRRGGRVSAAAAFLGTMLSIKPIMHVDDEGKLIPMEKAKGRARSIKGLFEHMVKTAVDPRNQTVFISHGDCEKDAQELATMIRSQLRVRDVHVSYIGPVIGSHSGPETIALFFVGTPR